MNEENKYVILLDENGQPYIAHESVREWAHRKAIAVIPGYYDSGENLYVYTQQQLANLQKRGGRMVKDVANKVDKKLGISAQRKLNQGRNLTGQEQVDYNKSVANKVRKSKATLDKHKNVTMETIRSNKKKVSDSAKNALNEADKKLGISAQRKRNQGRNLTGQEQVDYSKSVSGKVNAYGKALEKEGKKVATKTVNDIDAGIKSIKQQISEANLPVKIENGKLITESGNAYTLSEAALQAGTISINWVKDMLKREKKQE